MRLRKLARPSRGSFSFVQQRAIYLFSTMILSTKRLGRIALTASLSTITAALLLYRQEWLMLHYAANYFNNNSNTTPSDVPSWKIVDQPPVPYIGNLTCPYEIAHYNVDSHVNFIGSREKSRSCAKLRCCAQSCQHS